MGLSRLTLKVGSLGTSIVCDTSLVVDALPKKGWDTSVKLVCKVQNKLILVVCMF